MAIFRERREADTTLVPHSREGRDVPAQLPEDYPCSTFFVDESGAKQSAGRSFVVASIKTRKPGSLLRAVRAVRDNQRFDTEFKFNRITGGRVDTFYRLVDALADSDAHVAALAVHAESRPTERIEHDYVIHARLTARLLVGNINRHELCAAILDGCSTPVGHSYGDTVRRMVNHRLHRSLGLVSAVCADSRSNDGLQLADLVAGAIAHQQRGRFSGRANPHKARVAAHLAAAFGVSSFATDIRTPRVNVMTEVSKS